MTDSSRRAAFRARLRARETVTATFQRIPAYEVVEALALSGLDAVCLDTEHAPFDRARLDACLAVANAIDFPAIVRVTSAAPAAILQALDSGADGVLVPHVKSAEEAADAVRAARFGRGGRGYAGVTRSAGLGRQSMAEVLAGGAAPLVIAQIEDVEAVEQCEAICATPGLDAVFLGPADLSVALGQTDMTSPELDAAMRHVGVAAADNGLAYLTYVSTAEDAAARARHAVTGWFTGSDMGLMRRAAAQAAEVLRTAAG